MRAAIKKNNKTLVKESFRHPQRVIKFKNPSKLAKNSSKLSEHFYTFSKQPEYYNPGLLKIYRKIKQKSPTWTKKIRQRFHILFSTLSKTAVRIKTIFLRSTLKFYSTLKALKFLQEFHFLLQNSLIWGMGHSAKASLGRANFSRHLAIISNNCWFKLVEYHFNICTKLSSKNFA